MAKYDPVKWQTEYIRENLRQCMVKVSSKTEPRLYAYVEKLYGTPGISVAGYIKRLIYRDMVANGLDIDDGKEV